MDRPATAFARLRPRPGERIVLTNGLGLLALPLLAYLIFLGINANRYVLELPLQTDRPLTLRVDLEPGTASFALTLPAAPTPQTARVEFPAGPLSGLRLHLEHGGGAVSVGTATVRSQGDELLGSDRVRAVFRPETSPGADGLTFAPLAKPLALGFNASAMAKGTLLAGLLYAGLALAGLMAWRRLLHVEHLRCHVEQSRIGLERLYAAARRFIHARPIAAIWLTALAGVLLSCYPIVFSGRSFVSPNLGVPLLYDRYPTLPGSTDGVTGNGQGADISAILWAFVPYTAAQHRAIFADHEMPFWNRDNAGGQPLLGQGQSMLGDPLHWLVLLGGADAGTWDLKFLLARLLFAAGIASVVRSATHHQPTALLLGFASCFLGFFTYRFDHPANFGLCYAPWILLAWLEIARAGATPRWLGLWLLANWCEMNSGTVKEAYMFLPAFNAGGLLMLVLADTRTWRQKGRALVALLWVGACFVLVSAPLWWTLLDTLRHAWSGYDAPPVWQLQPGLIAGVFDDIFYRQFTTDEHVLDPSANFVVLLGVALAFRARRAPTLRAAGWSAAAAAALAFGVIPPWVIQAIPFLGSVSHCDNTFSAVLIVFLLVVAGHGLAHAWRRFGEAGWGRETASSASVLAVLVGMFLGLTQAAQRSGINFLPVNTTVPKSPFFWADLAALSAAFVGLPFLLRRFCLDRGTSAWGVAPWIALCLGAMLWRQALHGPLPSGLDRYTMVPTTRQSFYGRSAAVDFLHTRLRVEPGRVQGVGDNLLPGVGALFGLEMPSGPDGLQLADYHRLIAQVPMLWDWRLMLDRPTAAVPQLRRFYDALNVRYYLDAPGKGDISGLERVAGADLDVYESKTAWPRAFFTDGLEPCGDDAGFLVRTVHGDGRPFAAVGPDVLAARPELAALIHIGARQVVPATDYRLTTNTTAFHVRTTGPGVAALLEDDDGANAVVTINGQPASAFRVNRAFAGVYLPGAGDYVVGFRHRPRGWTAALGACALGLVMLAGSAAWVCRAGAPPAA